VAPALSTVIADLAARDPVLANLVALAGPVRHRPHDPDGRFGALVRSIVFQQLAGSAARAIHGRVRAAVAGELTPQALAAVSDEALRGAGLSAAKPASLRDLTAKLLDGSVDLARASRRSDGQVVAELSTLRGIGPWTPRCSCSSSCAAARYRWEAVHLFRGGTDPALR
jgi:3-methyladenine DNA glycosylase/8-oxoguanine DNA glycosylase